MARIRSVKPELRRDLTVAEWPRECRYAWVLLWGYLDDHGRGLDDLRLLVADLFPLDRDVTERKLDGWLTRMCAKTPHGEPPLCRYEIDGRRFLHAPKWTNSQRVSHPQETRIPPCPLHDRSGTAPESLAKQNGNAPDSFAPSRAPEDLGVKGSRDLGVSAPADEPPRLDVEQVCSAVADHVEKITDKRPTITEAWRTQARLLLDADDRPLADVLAVIGWVTRDTFWSANILSVPTLRKQFGQLYAKSKPTLQAVGSRSHQYDWDV